MTYIDALRTLNIYTDISESQLRAIYKREMKVNHPDNGGDTEVCKCINKAYSVLQTYIRNGMLIVPAVKNVSTVRQSNIIDISDIDNYDEKQLSNLKVRFNYEIEYLQKTVKLFGILTQPNNRVRFGKLNISQPYTKLSLFGVVLSNTDILFRGKIEKLGECDIQINQL